MTKYAAALSQHPSAVEAVGECAGSLLERLDGMRPDVVVLFASEHHRGSANDIADVLQTLLEPETLIGTTAAMVAGNDLEVEQGPALSVWAACLGGSRARTVRLDAVPGSDGVRLEGWPDDLMASGTLILLADPFSFPTGDFLELCNRRVAGLTVVGGLASAARAPGDNVLIADQRTYATGAVGVMLDKTVPAWTAVSQGCRPIGRPFTITDAERNVVRGLGGTTPLSRLQDIAATASDDERALLQAGLHVGIVVDEHRAEFARGDFLVRNVTGADPDTGAIGVGELVEVGQTLQFHVRDAESAREDLRLVAASAVHTPEHQARAALLFTCNGRGTHLFGRPHHDAATLERVGDDALELAGMSCAGEIGPVGGRAFLHGFTASMLLFGDESSTLALP
ncbi:MAG TPA: FIST N-terminal domain-containing protein [Acidimicrobiia bacterium]|jgi:small ligand-binding sensory domain FIST